MQVLKLRRTFDTCRRLKSHVRQERSETDFSVWKGGIMYADEARSMMRLWDEEELEKAKAALVQRAAYWKAIAEWKPILKEIKQTLEDQPACLSQ